MEPDRWLGVELRHLAALEAVGREGSFGRAAEKLGYTQSAISQQIATLERIVGTRLVERPGGPRPVRLTPAGELLLSHAESIMARLQAARADLAALAEGESGTLHVGTYQSVGARILPEVVRRFHDEWPRVDVELVESEADAELAEAVERGELDLSFVMLPLEEGPFQTLELMRDPYVLLVSPDHPLARKGKPPTMRELAEHPLLGFRSCRSTIHIEGQVRAGGGEPHVKFRSDDNGTIHGLVAAGVGVAIMPKLAVDPNDDAVVEVPLGPKFAPRLIGLAWHRDRYRSPAAVAFTETARQVSEELQRRSALAVA